MSDQSSETSTESDSPSSSPKAEVDDSPLQKCMDRNKQSLKVKLMMRRPYTQLVDQGIMPPLKTPASFHEQRQKLQRAKMGDLLKHKIQHRPDRTELIRQHILEADTGKIDPSLAERQRMLKRARLADSLNDQLSHRPGPLELIQKNILHTDENVERAVKEGQIAFKATCEGAAARPTHPFRYVTPEGDDSSSEGNAGGLSPSQDGSLDGSNVGTTAAATVSCNGVGGSPLTVISSLSPLSSVPSPGTAQQAVEQINAKNATPPAPPTLPTTLILPVASAPVPTAVSTLILKSQTESAPVVTNRNRKKSKAKCQPKPRTIKFHEYKGPPNAQKQQQTSSSNVETSYELLLQQQQLFLQWQLEWQHKYPQIILPASQKPSNSTNITSVSDNSGNTKQVAANLASFLAVAAPGVLTTVPIAASSTVTPGSSSTTTNSQPIASDVTRTTAKLEEMKVSDLKAELKKRNLPVSGSKPQLLERLRPFSNEDGTLNDRPVSRRGSHGQIQQTVQDEGPLPLSPAPPSSTSRRVSCSSLDGSISSLRGGSDVLLSSLSPASSALSMSPGPASVRPSSVINMDIDMELCESAPTPVIAEETIKMEPPPTPPPLPSVVLPHGPPKQEQKEINDLVRGLQEEQKALLEQQQLLRQQAAEEVASTNDPKAQQRLLLQQHLQLKIQQQQIQQQLQLLQQQQPDTACSMISPSRPTNRAHSRQMRTANKQPQHQAISRVQSTPQLSSNNRSSVPLISAQSSNDLKKLEVSNEEDTKPSLPTFANMFSPSQANSLSMSETGASSRPPPPDYSEAARLLQQQNGQRPRISVKSQLVDDVLDILIRSGELPPCAAQDPITPTTPRIELQNVPFPTSSNSSNDPPPPPPLPSHLISKSQPNVMDIKFPDIDINELDLDLDSLGDAMDVGVLDSTPSNVPMMPMPPNSRGDEDGTAMDLDDDWLDNLIPRVPTSGVQCPPSSSNSSASSSISGFSSLGSDPHHNYLSSLHLQQPVFNTAQQDQGSGDPLFSSLSSDPYSDLFSLEDGDLKLPTGLGNPLSWDRLDFTA